MTERPFVVGLDISKARTGVCFGGVGEKPRFLSIECKDLDDARATKKLGGWLIDFSKVNLIDFMAAEAAINQAAFMGEYDPEQERVKMTRSFSAGATLIKLVGVVEFITSSKRIRYEAAHVQRVRKAFLGSGRPDNPKKVAMAMCRELGWEPANMDEADAGAVWFWGCTRIAPRLVEPISPMLQARVIGRVNPRPFEVQYGAAR